MYIATTTVLFYDVVISTQLNRRVTITSCISFVLPDLLMSHTHEAHTRAHPYTRRNARTYKVAPHTPFTIGYSIRVGRIYDDDNYYCISRRHIIDEMSDVV